MKLYELNLYNVYGLNWNVVYFNWVSDWMFICPEKSGLKIDSPLNKKFHRI